MPLRSLGLSEKVTLVPTLIVLVTYLPSVILPYLVHNDYFLLLDTYSLVNPHPETSQLLGIGRPIDALILNAIVAPLSNFPVGMMILRAFALIIIYGIFFEFSKLLKLINGNLKFQAFLGAFFIITLPGIQYSLQCVSALNNNLSFLITTVATRHFVERNYNVKKIQFPIKCLAALCIVGLSYPAASAVFVIGIYHIFNEKKIKVSSWGFFDSVLLMLAPWVFNFICGQILTSAGLGKPVSGSTYTEQNFKLPTLGNFVNAIKGLLSLNFSHLLELMVFTVLLFIFIINLSYFKIKLRVSSFFIFIFAFIPLFFVSGYLNTFLSIQYGWNPESRSIIGLQALFFTILIFSNLNPKQVLFTKITLFLMIIICLLSVFRINYTLKEYFREHYFLTSKANLPIKALNSICFSGSLPAGNDQIIQGDLERRILNSHIASGVFPLWFKAQTGLLLPISLESCPNKKSDLKFALHWPEDLLTEMK